MKYADRITFDPEQCGGRPCIRHYRIRVKDILDMLADGVSESEILQDFPFFAVGRHPGLFSIRRNGGQPRLKSTLIVNKVN